MKDFAVDLKRARSIIAKKKLDQKISSDSDNLTSFTTDDIEFVRHLLSVIEFALIDLLSRKNSEDEKESLKALCKEYYFLSEAVPLPEESDIKIRHVLKLVSFCYLAEKWEDARRFLRESEAAWQIVDNDAWNVRIFQQVYLSILLLVRKEGMGDLERSLQVVQELKQTQAEFEKIYFDQPNFENKRGAAFQLASLYHFARATELLAKFNANGTPHSSRLLNEMGLHFEKASKYAELSGDTELELILMVVHRMFDQMVKNSIWRISETINSNVTKFVKNLTKASSPVFELLYPQRFAVLEGGLLDPAHRAIVVNAPTSSGKTLIAEFKILQAYNQCGNEGWIAYIAPTRALVNQIAARLRRDLGKEPLSLKVEKMSGALEIDAIEERIISVENSFNILVTTPEKLSLLIRQKIEEKMGRKLVLVVADEIQNLEDKERGLNLEMLLSIVQNDCDRANFLLLTPFVPNAELVARWLDPQNPKAISISVDNWMPNHSVVGMFYPIGSRRQWNLEFKPLLSSGTSLEFTDEVDFSSQETDRGMAISQLSRWYVAAEAAKELKNKGNTLLVINKKDGCWNAAKILNDSFDNIAPNENIDLLQRYIKSELGEGFPLAEYLQKGIGVHHSGIPEEIRFFEEWLMEEGLLRTLVSTSTIAQGINFPVDTILMSSTAYPYGEMPMRDFWNLVGRAGRMDHSALGVVGIALENDKEKSKIRTAEYVKKNTDELTSVLVGMVDDVINLGKKLNLKQLSFYPEWSAFVQFISHMFVQSNNLADFIAQLELTMRKTYGYSLLSPDKRELLLNSVKEYALELEQNRGLATLSDQTGLTPEAIKKTMKEMNDLGMTPTDWSSDNLFSANTDSRPLKDLVGVMLGIPEIGKNLKIEISGTPLSQETIAELITAWVSGDDMPALATLFFEGNESACVTTLYGKISNAATWGMASILKVPGSGIDYDDLSEEDIRRLTNIPAMIYYGVNTDEAILMRSNNIPRSIAKSLGKKFLSIYRDIYTVNSETVNTWLRNLPEEEWSRVVPQGSSATGSDYQVLWKRLSGNAS